MRWFVVVALTACSIDETGLLPADGAPPILDATQDARLADAAQDVAAPDNAASDVTTAPDVSEAGNPVLTLVQNQTSAANGASVSTGITPLSAGNLVVVLAVYIDVNATITGVTDNASGGSNTYVSANLRSSVGTCQAAEIWYARDVQPGATSVTTRVSNSCQLAVWVLEVSGASTTMGVDVGNVGSGPATTTITVPALTPSGVPAFIAAAVGSCGTLAGIASGPFTALTEQYFNGGAFYIAKAPGTYGPVFLNSYDAWNASIAAFR